METRFKKGQAAWNKSGWYKPCLVCSADTWTTPGKEKTGRGKYCSLGCRSDARKNMVVTEETRKKLSEAHKGKPKNYSLKGDKHPNWKGGVTKQDRLERMKFRRKMQRLVFERDNYTCQFCESTGSVQVDHIKRWKDYPELRFDMDNCRTLCMACHYYITFKKKIPKGTVWGHNLSKTGGVS